MKDAAIEFVMDGERYGGVLPAESFADAEKRMAAIRMTGKVVGWPCYAEPVSAREAVVKDEQMFDPSQECNILDGTDQPCPRHGSHAVTGEDAGLVERVTAFLNGDQDGDEIPIDDLRALLDRLASMAAEIERLREAGAKLIAKIDECAPHIANAFEMEHVRGRPYSGPHFGEELEAFRQALTAKT